MWLAHNYALLPATDASRQLAADMVGWYQKALAHKPNTHPKRGVVESIPGQVLQFAVERAQVTAEEAGMRQQLLQRWHELMRESLDAIGEPLSHLQRTVCAPKVLSAAPGAGLQAIHYDVAHPDARSAAGDLSAILYLTPTQSTALPIYDARAGEQLLHEEAEVRRKLAPLVDPLFFHSVPVEPGNLVLFRHGVMHYGVANEGSSDPRLVLFSMLCTTPPQITNDPDAFQQHVWTWVAEAFGEGSPRHLATLDQYKGLQPLRHFTRDYATSLKQKLKEEVSKAITTL